MSARLVYLLTGENACLKRECYALRKELNYQNFNVGKLNWLLKQYDNQKPAENNCTKLSNAFAQTEVSSTVENSVQTDVKTTVDANTQTEPTIQHYVDETRTTYLIEDNTKLPDSNEDDIYYSEDDNVKNNVENNVEEKHYDVKTNFENERSKYCNNYTPAIHTVNFPTHTLERHILPPCKACGEIMFKYANRICPTCPLVDGPFTTNKSTLCSVAFGLIKYDKRKRLLEKLLVHYPSFSCLYKQDTILSMLQQSGHCMGNNILCACQCNSELNKLVTNYTKTTCTDETKNYYIEGMYVLDFPIPNSLYKNIKERVVCL